MFYENSHHYKSLELHLVTFGSFCIKGGGGDIYFCRKNNSSIHSEFNFFQINGIFNKATYILPIMGAQGTVQFPNNIVFLSLKIDFVLTNSTDPDEMAHNTVFHLGLHFFFPRNPLRCFRSTEG